MPNLSRVNVIEYYNRLLNQIYSSIKNEKEMLISAHTNGSKCFLLGRPKNKSTKKKYSFVVLS